MKLEFKAKRISKTATIQVQNRIENVFPLFGAFEEKKWAKGWNPENIYPDNDKIEEGTTFKTDTTSDEENEFLWIITKYEIKNYLIQYLVFTKNRYWTITIKCMKCGKNETSATITYTFTGLNSTGNKLNKNALQKMYENNLLNWEEAINQYFKNSNS